MNSVLLHQNSGIMQRLLLTENGRALETKPGSFSMVLNEPIGVAGIIAPLEFAYRSHGAFTGAGPGRRLYGDNKNAFPNRTGQ